ncbi:MULTISPECIES: phosphatase PAP2 family protein [unclassified Paenarthrobacter]|uniref:phosphatase PAP2 family protein n=1 Tax=unclassified Paenarthrobacter TaxID=2634190 RepID=UPI001FB75381|nr:MULTISPECIES: phosphatase PAP2 family protein [unclassified Paenarthrobacter]MCM0616310.1 phosphatase PAP2 family protein [Paenarthrobacter sp. TYUT067]
MFPHSAPHPVRFNPLPAPKHWLIIGLVLAAAVVLTGWAIQVVPGLTLAELAVDDDFSRHHTPVLTGLALVLNALFGPVAGTLIVIAVSLYLALIRRSPQNAALFSLTVACGWLTCQLFKVVTGRIRPDPALLFDPLVPEPVSNSFPSGHTSLAVALTLATFLLVRETRWAKPVLWAGTVMAVVVAWSRVYIGAHYPLDVVASFPATIAAVLIMAGTWNRFAPAVMAAIHSRATSPRSPK